MNITKPQIEELIDEKGNPRKCLECGGTLFKKIAGISYPCDVCFHTGKATIEIDKELNICKCGCHSEDNAMRLIDCLHLSCEGKIQKQRIGDEIYIWHSTLKDVILSKQEYELMLSALDKDEKRETKEETDILKIISETETKQYVQMV